MKKVFPFMAVWTLGMAAMAQSFNIQILDPGNNDVTNGIYAIPGIDGSQGGHTDIKFKIKNNGASDAEIRVRRENVQMPPGFNNTICIDGFCYPAESDESQFPLNLGAGVTDSSFYGTFNNPSGTTGDLCVTYIIFNSADESQFVTVRAYYGACLTASVGESVTAESVMLSAFPNPANGSVNIRYNPGVEARLLVTDLTGKQVKNVKLNPANNTLLLDISDLRPGLYVYSVQAGNRRVISKKLIVK
jgi:hypothetical protein